MQKSEQVKLVPINDVAVTQQQRDRNRLKHGCTGLMYACQQGLTDKIVKEIRFQVKMEPTDHKCVNVICYEISSKHVNQFQKLFRLAASLSVV